MTSEGVFNAELFLDDDLFAVQFPVLPDLLRIAAGHDLMAAADNGDFAYRLIAFEFLDESFKFFTVGAFLGGKFLV